MTVGQMTFSQKVSIIQHNNIQHNDTQHKTISIVDLILTQHKQRSAQQHLA
jgi:hypothetical protein